MLQGCSPGGALGCGQLAPLDPATHQAVLGQVQLAPLDKFAAAMEEKGVRDHSVDRGA
jgi:hypothetical protein